MRRFVALLACALPATARAEPRTLPFTFTTDTLPSGNAEVEQYIDLVPLRGGLFGAERSFLASAFATELEFGLSDRWELALTVTLVPAIAELETQPRFAGTGTGLKQRLRYRLNEDPHVWPVVGNVALLAELTENDAFFEAEGRILLERLLTDRLRLAGNFQYEYQWWYAGDRRAVITATAGAAFELRPTVRAGIEGWLREEFADPRPADVPFAQRRQIYAGPTIAIAKGRVWWTTGVYARFTEVGHDLGPADPYGKIWVRTMIGYALSR